MAAQLNQAGNKVSCIMAKKGDKSQAAGTDSGQEAEDYKEFFGQKKPPPKGGKRWRHGRENLHRRKHLHFKNHPLREWLQKANQKTLRHESKTPGVAEAGGNTKGGA
jgi:hypothetical protein